MTDDQRERLNRFLVENVMGWRQIETWWVSPEGFNVIYVKEYQPVVCLRDCEPLLDKIEEDKRHYSFDNVTDGGYGCHVWGQPHSGHGWSKDSRTEALCLAIARCYSWKEEA